MEIPEIVLVEDHEDFRTKYPLLMKSPNNGRLVLMTGDNEGVQLNKACDGFGINPHRYRISDVTWDTRHFAAVACRITLESDENGNVTHVEATEFELD